MRFSRIKKLILLLFVGIAFSLFSASCFAKSQPKAWNLSDENLFFVGREEHLQNIHGFFNKGKRRILALTGGSGFGKSQIAKKFALQFAGDYDLIWWFDAQQDIPFQFERLTVALNTLLPMNERIVPSTMSKEALIDSVKNILRIKPIKYLFIFDNAEDYNRISKFIPYAHQSPRKNILLTSRIASLWPDRLEVGKFKREESLQFLKEALPQAKNKERTQLAETLVDYPLELTIAVAHIKSHPTLTIDRYLSMHVNRKRNKVEGPLLDGYPNTSLGALEISLKDIEKESKDSLQALFFMSLLNSKDIPETYIDLWLKKMNSTLTADEAIKHVYDKSLLGVSETTEFNANKKPEERQDMYYLSIHDFIHQLINEQLSVEEKRQYIDQATKVLLDVFSSTAEVFTKMILEEPVHLLHAEKLCKNAKAIGHANTNLLKLKVRIFQCLVAPLRDFEKAKDYLKEIEEGIKAGLELDSYSMAIFKISNGALECIYNVNYDEAIRNMKEGLTLLDDFKDYNDGKLRAIANLAQYYTLRGEPDLAEEIIGQGKSIFNNAQSAEYKTFYIWAWSLVLTDQGRYEEAIKVLDKANGLPHSFPVFEQGLLQQRTLSYVKLGKIKEATNTLKHFEKAIKEFFQGKSKMALGSVWEYKSHILIYKKKNISTVFAYLNKALEQYKEFFRGDKKHRLQGRAHLVMGKAHTVAQEYEKALMEYLLSEEIYNLVLKEKKIDDVSDLYAELAILGTTLKDEGMAQKYLNTHIETFGLGHPRTEKILKYLDRSNLGI